MKLGFGMMRLPRTEGGSIDVEQTKAMVDLFMKAGGTIHGMTSLLEEFNAIVSGKNVGKIIITAIKIRYTIIIFCF